MPEVALLDRHSQYLSRSRYFERLRPFLDRFDRAQIHVVVQERLLCRRPWEMRRALAHVGVDPTAVDESELNRLVHRGASPPRTPTALRARFGQDVAEDVERLRDLLDDALDEWSTT